MLNWIKKWINGINLWNQKVDPINGFHNNLILHNKNFSRENMIQSTLKNSVAMACIHQIYQNIRAFNMDHNIHQYFNNDIYILLESILMEWMFYGNVFLVVDNNSLKVLSTSEITYHNNKIYYKNHKLKDYIHLKNYNLWANDWGHSPLESVISHIQQYNTINEYLNTVAGRGGITSGIIISKNSMNSATRDKLQEDIKNFYRNVNSQGTIMVLEGDFSWTSIAISPQDLDIKKMNHYNGSAIARGLGIHPVLIGLDKRSYGGFQYGEINKQFIATTLKPLYSKIIAQLQDEIYQKYNININIKVEYNDNI